MIALYIAIGVVIGIPLVMFLVGKTMRERYDAQMVVVLNRKPEEVWSAMCDYQGNPMTGKMRKRTELLADVNGLPSWKEHMGSSQMLVTTVHSHKPTRLQRTMADTVVPMTADWEMVLEAVPEGCRATTTSVTVIRDGTWHVPFFRVMVGVFGGVKAGMRAYWKGVAGSLGASLRFE